MRFEQQDMGALTAKKAASPVGGEGARCSGVKTRLCKRQ